MEKIIGLFLDDMSDGVVITHSWNERSEAEWELPSPSSLYIEGCDLGDIFPERMVTDLEIILLSPSEWDIVTDVCRRHSYFIIISSLFISFSQVMVSLEDHVVFIFPVSRITFSI